MTADAERVYEAIGELREQVSNLSRKIDDRDARSTEEHRKVHDIIVAMSESTRIMARDVAEMKPHVEAYKMKAEKLDDAVTTAEAYRVEKHEERGAEKYKKWMLGLFASGGALGAVGIGKLIDRWWPAVHLPPGPPHP